MVPPRLFALLVALALLPATLVAAKPKSKPAAPATPAASQLPSARLQAFSAKHLEYLLGPLGPGKLPRGELLQMETQFKERLARGVAGETAMLQDALAVCTAFDKIVDEREKAVLTLNQGTHAETSNKDESKARRKMAKEVDHFIAAGARSAAQANWQQRGQPWRLQLQQLLVNEKEAETAAKP